MNKFINFRTINSEKITMFTFFIILLLLPYFMSAYNILNISYFLSMVLLSISLWFIWGMTGIFSFGQTAFFGIGAYTYAIVSMNSENPNMTIIGLLSALIVAWAVAFILGYFMFYGGVKDVFVGIITLCLTLVISTFLAQSAGSKWKIGDVPLGGYNGITNIPPIELEFGGFNILLINNTLYYTIAIVLILMIVFLQIMLRNKFGYSFIATRENTERSELLGYNIPFLQTLSFSIGGVIAALSGVLYVVWGGYISPSSMDISAAALPVVLVAAAGRKNLSGVVLFTIFYYYFAQKLSTTGSEYALIILGFLLILVILLIPKGIVETLFNLVDRLLFDKRRNVEK